MKILIVDKVSRAIQSVYEAASVPTAEEQAQRYGGPWGNPIQTIHLAIPEGEDLAWISIAEDMEVVIDAELKASIQATRDITAIQSAVKRAMDFGDKLLMEFTSENVALGITQAGKTSAVRKALSEVVACLNTGSLYDAIAELKAVPASKYDAKFITDERMLAAINKIETYLGLPLSTDI